MMQYSKSILPYGFIWKPTTVLTKYKVLSICIIPWVVERNKNSQKFAYSKSLTHLCSEITKESVL